MESLPTVGRMPGSQSCLPPAPASPNAMLEQDETNALFDLPFSYSFHIFIIVHGFKAQAKDKIRQREKERRGTRSRASEARADRAKRGPAEGHMIDQGDLIEYTSLCRCI